MLLIVVEPFPTISPSSPPQTDGTQPLAQATYAHISHPMRAMQGSAPTRPSTRLMEQIKGSLSVKNHKAMFLFYFSGVTGR